MKTFLKIVAGFVVVVVLALVAVFHFTAGMADAADEFFAAIQKQDLAAARSYLSEDFRAHTDELALKEFLTQGALLNFKEARWSSRQISGGRGELEGKVITDAGGVVPIKLLFVKENEAWRIYGIQKPTAGLQPDLASPYIPAKEEQRSLVKKAMQDFAVSVNDRSMKHFHGTISQLWKRQFTVDQLDQAYGSLFDAGLDLTVLGNIDPTIEPVSGLSDNGELLLRGVFPSEPTQINFEQTFIYEGTGWKLIGFSVSTK